MSPETDHGVCTQTFGFSLGGGGGGAKKSHV